MKKFEKKTPTSDVVRHCTSGAVELFFIPENFIWNEGATQTWCGHGRSGVVKHEIAGGKCGGGLSGAHFLGRIRQ